MNVNQLQPPPQTQLQRVSKEASEKEADFLALRLLNKRSRLRLSPQPLDLDSYPTKARLFAVANRAGWFAVATRNSDGSYALVVSPLADLRSVFSSSSSDGPLSIQPHITLPFPATPHIVVFTQDDARLLVAFTNGSISVYDSQAVFRNSTNAALLHTFPSSTGKPVRDLLPSPGDMELVVVLREAGDGTPVEILDTQKMLSVGGWNGSGSPATNPISVSWSPKGKQIAIGLESGDILTFSPTDTASIKSVVPRPSGADGQSVISALWLSNPEFHAIYVPAGQISPDVEQSHYILSLDSRANMAGDVKLSSPYLPFPGLKPPGSFVVVLRNWEPSRLLLFVGDSTSSDIGLVGSLSGSGSQLDSWYNFTLEETSTPSVPLDSDMNETVLLGLELDLTNNKPYTYTGPSGEETDVPPPPIMYLYASDGTLTGWHVIQTQGIAYPGMVAASSIPAITSPAAATQTTTPGDFASPAAPSTSPSQPRAFDSTSATPGTNLGFSAFSGAPSAFGSTGFGFGKPASPTQSLQAPPLTTPSMSVEMASVVEDSMVSETDTGLGGMSLGGASDNSQSKSGTGTNSMFGTFGGQQQNNTSISPFGAGATASPAFSAFGSGPVKPGTGFGAFAGSGNSAFGSSSAFGSNGSFGGGSAFGSGASSGTGAFGSGTSAFASKPASDSDKSAKPDSKPTSAFGQSAFGQSSFGAPATKPAFGQSAFGQSNFGQSSFGQPSFGKSAFGQSAFGSSSFGSGTTTPAKPVTTSAFGSSSSGGGFAAFASAPTSFASAAQQKTPDAKPVWASGSQQTEQKPAESSLTTTSTPDGPSAFAAAKPADTTSSAPAAGGAFANLGQSSQGSTFGKPSFGQTTFGQSSFGQSSFGQPSFGKSTFGQPATPTSTPPKPVSATPASGGFASFATAGPSAFSTAAAQASPSGETKPIWATPATADKLKQEEQQQSKSPLGSATGGSSVFGSTQAATSSSATPTTTTPASSPEKPAAPATPIATPPATPDTKPTTSEATSTTPATPAPGGAFASLTTSTTGFAKLQSGFGAFGTTTPTSSPFLQKRTTQSNSVFGQTSFGAVKAEDRDGTAKPTSAFGSPSPLGQSSFFGKSSFASAPSPFAKPAVSTSTSTSAFSAFSSAPSPFAAAANGAKKSFGDMLREKEGDKAEETKSQGTSKTAEEWKKPVSVFASLKQAAAERDARDEEEEEVGNVSFRSHGEDEEGEGDEGSDPGDDGIDDFLKSDEEDVVSEEEEAEEEEEEEEEEAEGVAIQSQTPPESPTAKQPASQKSPATPFVGGVFLSKDTRARSTSPTRSPVPVVKVEPESPPSVPPRQGSATPPGSPSDRTSPTPADGEARDIKGKAPAREGSTTPPGSPAAAPPARAASAPPASSSSSAPASGLLGVGRPSTRPARSSPLASQPISGDDLSDEEEERDGELESSPKKARSASPAMATPTSKSVAQEPTSRPKTPPLLFGAAAKPPTPSPFSLSPTAPPLFGPKSTTPTSEKVAEPTKPATPVPTPSLKGPGTPGSSSIFSAPPVFSPPTPPQSGLFGQKTATPTAGGSGFFGEKLAAPASGLFGQKPSAASPGSVFSSPSSTSATKPSAFPPAPADPAAAPPTAPRPSSIFGGGFGSFNAPGQSAKPSMFGTFGTPSALPAKPDPSLSAPAPAPPATATPQPSVAEGMQTECLYLFSSLAKELEDLKSLANRASARTAQLGKPGSGNKTVEDLANPTKWVLGDLPQFKLIMKEVERELESWEKEKATCISYVRELESDLLKATTRKEEIERFSRASRDTEFARMLKARTLNPEHLETQAQLRREIRTIRGRIQQLEDHIQASKKKLNSLKNGKPTLKPPSLDTINRTYRNIDRAIEQEEEDVSNLADRVAQLDMNSHSRSILGFSASTARDKRLPDRTDRVGREVTPNIAASTAAALNAERSAQKLKRALLSARKEPLLNTKAVDALPPKREARISRKPLLAPDSGLGVGAAFAAGLNNGFPPLTPSPTPSFAPPLWNPPPPGAFGTSLAWSVPSPPQDSPGSRLGAMRGAKEKKHGSPIHASGLGQAAKPASLAPPSGFSWGPVPKIEPKKTISVFTELGSRRRFKEEEPEITIKEEEKELESSWVADGFGTSKS
ncbi:hypothetical protein C8Q73DRAFT_634146 [Cubamyces lactineus]|nr:hypothetical protein C8Q73DRAFT_634146 [Cubamyces lactineus]